MANRTSTATKSLLDELETTLAHGSVARRVETLRRVTDVFLGSRSLNFSDEQLALFDDVFHCLVRHIETSAMVMLAERLGPAPVAPPRIIRRLACNDLIEIAAPVLSKSMLLDEGTLLNAARHKSQAHLLAISKRKSISGAVADLLVERGNDEVVHHTVTNPGAELTEQAYCNLLERAVGDDDLATCIGLRPSIPRHHYLKLTATASASVRARLDAANPGRGSEVSLAVNEALRHVRSTSAAMSRETLIAHGLVKLLYEDGRLDEPQITAFADAGKFDETTAAIACVARVPISSVEAMMIDANHEGVLILSKVCGLSWAAVRSIIALRDELDKAQTGDIETLQATYEQLRPSTAQQVMRFHRMEQSSAAIPAPAA